MIAMIMWIMCAPFILAVTKRKFQKMLAGTPHTVIDLDAVGAEDLAAFDAVMGEAIHVSDSTL